MECKYLYPAVMKCVIVNFFCCVLRNDDKTFGSDGFVLSCMHRVDLFLVHNLLFCTDQCESIL